MADTKGTNGKRGRRWIWILAAGAVLALIVVMLRPAPIEVDVGAADRGPLRVTIDEEGETRVRDRYVVSAPVSGRVLRIELEPGDPVAVETTLAILQPAPPQPLDARSRAEAQARFEAAAANLGRARADLSRAQAESRYAVSEYDRIDRLVAERIVSQELRDSVKLQMDTSREAQRAAEFAVRTAEHNLAQARATLRRDAAGDAANQEPITIHSPVDGVVLRRLRESAAVVNVGEPLIEVADPSRLEIVADFLSEDAVKIPVGAVVLIERWGGDLPLRGRVRRVEPSGFTKISALGVEEQRVNVIVDLADPREAWNALGDGFRVDVAVVIWESADVLRIPTSSLFRSGTDWAVFTLVGNEAKRTLLEIGQRNGVHAEVLSGLPNTDRWTSYLAEELGHEVTVIATTAGPYLPNRAYEIVPLPVRGRFGYLTVGLRIKQHLRRIRPDVLIGYRIQSNGFAAALTGFRPLVLAAQSENIVKPPLNPVAQLCSRYALRRADLLQAWGSHIGRRMEQLGADPEKILTLPRGVDAKRFSPPAAPVTEPVLIVTRSLRAVYRHATLLTAFRDVVDSLPDARLLIAGDGEERDNLTQLTANLNLQPNVIFLGQLESPDLAERLRSAHCYVTLVGTEGVSSSLLEALGCGLLPVVPDLPGNLEWVKDAENGLIVPLTALEQPGEVARLLLRAFSDAALRQSAFDRNVDLVVHGADWHTNMRRMESAYRELVERG